MATADVLDKVDILGPHPQQTNLQADFDKVESHLPPLDPVKLKEKYIAERDKRLEHGGGIDQYRLVDDGGQFAHYLTDPWVEPGFTRDPVSEQVDAVIIGGGYGAQLVAVRLIEAGVKSIRLIEKVSCFRCRNIMRC
jgi:cyclohexanone monooxygenase